jgi:hypothetical protein
MLKIERPSTGKQYLEYFTSQGGKLREELPEKPRIDMMVTAECKHGHVTRFILAHYAKWCAVFKHACGRRIIGQARAGLAQEYATVKGVPAGHLPIVLCGEGHKYVSYAELHVCPVCDFEQEVHAMLRKKIRGDREIVWIGPNSPMRWHCASEYKCDCTRCCPPPTKGHKHRSRIVYKVCCSDFYASAAEIRDKVGFLACNREHLPRDNYQAYVFMRVLEVIFERRFDYHMRLRFCNDNIIKEMRDIAREKNMVDADDTTAKRALVNITAFNPTIGVMTADLQEDDLAHKLLDSWCVKNNTLLIICGVMREKDVANEICKQLCVGLMNAHYFFERAREQEGRLTSQHIRFPRRFSD